MKYKYEIPLRAINYTTLMCMSIATQFTVCLTEVECPLVS